MHTYIHTYIHTDREMSREPLSFSGEGKYPAGGGVEINPGDHRDSPTTTMKQMSNTDEISILETSGSLQQLIHHNLNSEEYYCINYHLF
jgi:hypothetical protein